MGWLATILVLLGSNPDLDGALEVALLEGRSVDARCSEAVHTPYAELLCLELALHAHGGAGVRRQLLRFEAEHPAWAATVNRVRARAERAWAAQASDRRALGTYALAMALLLLAGARTLLTPSWAPVPVVLGATVGAGLLWFGSYPPVAVASFTLMGISGAVAVHAADAAARRTEAVPRVRVLLVVLALLAVGSQAWAFHARSGRTAVRVDGSISPP